MAKKVETLYVCFVENNDWEGETWNFYIPECYFAQIQDLLVFYENYIKEKNQDDPGIPYSIKSLKSCKPKLYSIEQIKVLVDNDHGSYMSAHNLIKDQLNQKAIIECKKEIKNDEDPFYKGDIKRLFR